MAEPARPLFVEPQARPKPVAVPLPAPPADQGELGPCLWVVDAETRKKCGEPGVKEIMIGRDDGVKALIAVCDLHKATHNNLGANRRIKK